jgi:hydroxypyruvate isomerase
MHYGVCLEMVHTNRPFLDRIPLATEAGFRHAEMWFTDGTFNGKDCNGDPKKPDAVRKAADKAGVRITNTVVGSPDGGLGGGLIDPNRRDEWIVRTKATLAFNKAAGIPACIVCTGNSVAGMTETLMRKYVVENLKQTAGLAEKAGVTLLLEPLNTHVDHAGYFLAGSDQAAEICRAVDSPHLKLLFDCYHMQIMEGDLVAHIRRSIDVIGHFHSAGVPGRNELWKGEVNYPFVVEQIAALGYTGVFAVEYAPTIDHAESLSKTLAYLPAGK